MSAICIKTPTGYIQAPREGGGYGNYENDGHQPYQQGRASAPKAQNHSQPYDHFGYR